MSLNGVITGGIGVGKTTVCRRVVDLARERGHTVAGLLTPAILDEDGDKIGIAALDLETGEQRELARVWAELGGPRMGKYSFDAEALQWACGVLDRAAAEGCDLYVVDEIGPLELVRDEGFVRTLTMLETGILPRTLVVVRDSYLDLFRKRVPGLTITEFWVMEENRAEIAEEIANRLFLRPPEEVRWLEDLP